MKDSLVPEQPISDSTCLVLDQPLYSDDDGSGNNCDNSLPRRSQQQQQNPLNAVGFNRPDSLRMSSLTAEYEGFNGSSSGLRMFLLHALIYFSLAVVGYSFLVEDWPVVDALYFATTLWTTIGFGDISPGHVQGQLFTIFLALYGIVILGILLGMLGEYLIDQNAKASREKRDKVGTQLVQLLRDDNNSVGNMTDDSGRYFKSPNVLGNPTRERSLWEDVWGLAVKEAPILTIVALVGMGVGYWEGWDATQSLYWLFISGTTIGLGDYHPNRTTVKLFCVFFLPVAVAVFGKLLASIASIYMDRKRRQAERAFLSRSLTLCDLTTMDTDGNGNVDKAEFLSFMLVALQKVSKDDVREICDLFHKLDGDGSNFLSMDDLLARDWDESFRSCMSETYVKRNIS